MGGAYECAEQRKGNDLGREAERSRGTESASSYCSKATGNGGEKRLYELQAMRSNTEEERSRRSNFSQYNQGFKKPRESSMFDYLKNL